VVVNQKQLREAEKTIRAVLEALPATEDTPRDAALRRRLEGAVLALEELTKKPSTKPENP
jgi:hypothetical protein